MTIDPMTIPCPFCEEIIFRPIRGHKKGTASSHHPEERLVLHHVPLRRPASEGQDVRRPRNASRDSLEDLHII